MLHKNSTLGNRHPVHNWSVADAAALAALVVDADDIGKVAAQIDTADFLMLTAVAPSPVWESIIAPEIAYPVTSVNGATGAVVVSTHAHANKAFLDTVTDLKTINGTSIIGTGDLVVAGGGGGAYEGPKVDNWAYALCDSFTFSNTGWSCGSFYNDYGVGYYYIPKTAWTMDKIGVKVQSNTSPGTLNILVYTADPTNPLSLTKIASGSVAAYVSSPRITYVTLDVAVVFDPAKLYFFVFVMSGHTGTVVIQCYPTRSYVHMGNSNTNPAYDLHLWRKSAFNSTQRALATITLNSSDFSELAGTSENFMAWGNKKAGT